MDIRDGDHENTSQWHKWNGITKLKYRVKDSNTRILI